MGRITTLKCADLTETHMHFLNAIVHFIFVFTKAYHLRYFLAHKHSYASHQKEAWFIVSVFHI